MKTTRPASFLAIPFLAYLAWGAFFVWRSSFLYQGERVFCLWDDAMISMQYARNLSEGAGLIWIPGGERVQGISNLGVSLLMTVVHWLPLKPERLSLVVQIMNLALLGAVVASVRSLGRIVFPDRPAVSLAAALGTALCAPLAVWSLFGADVGFVAAWLAAAVLGLAACEQKGSMPRWLLPALAPGLLLRPDVVVFHGLILLTAWRLPGGRRAALEGAACAALVLAGWGLVGALYYGDPLPNTYYLKATGSPRMLVLAKGIEQVGEWLPRLAPALALATFATWRRRSSPILLLCAALPIVGLFYAIWIGGDWSHEYGLRFVAPTLPLLWFLCAAGANDLLERIEVGPRAATAMPFLLVAAVSLFANPPTAAREWLVPSATPAMRLDNRAHYFFARYLAAWTDPDTSLGAHWGGVPPYFSRRPAVDVLGKSDRHIARMQVDRFVPAHSKWDWDYVLRERRPDVFRAPSRGLDRRADFRRDYVKVTKGPGQFFYMRRDALEKLHDADVVFVDLVTGAESRPEPRSH